MTPLPATRFVLVTGATGNVGFQIVELLLAAGVLVCRGLERGGRPLKVPFTVNHEMGRRP